MSPTTITVNGLSMEIELTAIGDYSKANAPRVPLEDFSDLGKITQVGYRFDPHYPQLNGPVFYFEVREGDYAEKPRMLVVKPDYDRVDIAWADDADADLRLSTDMFDICHAIYGALEHTWDVQILPAMLAAAATAMNNAPGFLR